jgi:hypothetical protein
MGYLQSPSFRMIRRRFYPMVYPTNPDQKSLKNRKDRRRTEETEEEDAEPTMGDKSLTCKTGHGRRRRDEKEKEARREWRRIKKD